MAPRPNLRTCDDALERIPCSAYICHSAAMSYDIFRCSHVQSDEHDETCEEYEDEGWEVCWDCGTKDSENNMEPHLTGRKHQQRVKLTYCDICKSQTISYDQMLEHLDGKRHRQVARIANWSCPC